MDEIIRKEIIKFETELRNHCNVEYDYTGDEIVKSSVNSVLIAFEEWFKKYKEDEN